MDHANPVETPTTYRLHRTEYLIGFAVATVLMIEHWRDINWWEWAAFFLYIDVIGYLPGAFAYKRSPDKKISKGYYVAYNTMHSLITQSVVAGLVLWLAGPTWALLAIPFHLFGDRGIFGNFLKPFDLPFEPELPSPAYQRYLSDLKHSRTERTPEPLSVVPDRAAS